MQTPMRLYRNNGTFGNLYVYSIVLILISFVSNKTLVTLNAFTTAGGDIKKMKNILYYSCCALGRVTSTTLGRAAAQ